MPVFLTLLVMLIVAYAQCREGLLSAAAMFINILLAGILAFNVWEPLTNEFDVLFGGTLLSGFEDAIVLALLFTLFLVLLRAATSKAVPNLTEFPGYVQQLGGGIFGLMAGYLVAGFLLCLLQTLPWHENFLGFKPRVETESGLRSILPPDRVWLALMRQAGAQALSWKEDRADADTAYDRHVTFDGAGTFELRYARYRRYGDKRDPMKYAGELERELRKEKTPLNSP